MSAQSVKGLRERYDRVMAKPSSEEFSGEDLHELAAVAKEATDEIERLQARLIEITLYRLGSEEQLKLADLRAIAQEALEEEPS